MNWRGIMKKFFEGFLKMIVKLLIVLLVTSVIIAVISNIWGYRIKNLCMIFGLLYMFLGLGSMLGNINMTSNVRYNYIRSASNDNFSNSIKQDFFSRDKSAKFLLYTGIIGLILIFAADFFE
jgi:Na+/H+ antiporter NhaC